MERDGTALECDLQRVGHNRHGNLKANVINTDAASWVQGFVFKNKQKQTNIQKQLHF